MSWADMTRCRHVCLLFAFIQGVRTAEWSNQSVPEGATLYACAQTTVTMAWDLQLDDGEAVDELRWLLDGRSQELVATYTNGHFLPAAAFGNRVEAVGSAGITIRRLAVLESGNYSVLVTGHNGTGDSFTLGSSVALTVTDQLMTADGRLHVRQRHAAVLDPDSDQWSIQLQCGTFLFADNPPFHVEWTTPSGQTVNSTAFSDHHFNLLVPNPVVGGNYTCVIPLDQADQACLHDHSGHQGQATLYVDRLESRLFLLEEENRQLKKRVEQFARWVSRRVGFHAKGLSNQTPHIGDPLAFPNVLYNEGEAYNSSSGLFRAPYPGLYLFLARTAVYNGHSFAEHALYVGDVQLDYAYTFDDSDLYYPGQGTVQGVVRLTAGQQVWVRSYGSWYWGGGSVFSGVLLASDLP